MTDTDRIACRKAAQSISTTLRKQFEFEADTEEATEALYKGIQDTVLEHMLPLLKNVRDSSRRSSTKSKSSGSGSGSGSEKKSHRPNYYAMLHKIFSPKAAGGYDYLFEGHSFEYQPDLAYLESLKKKPQTDFYDKVHSEDHADLLAELTDFKSESIADVVVMVEKALESLGQKSAQMVRTAVIWNQFMSEEWREEWKSSYKQAVEDGVEIEARTVRKPKQAKATAKAKGKGKPSESESEPEPGPGPEAEPTKAEESVYDASTDDETVPEEPEPEQGQGQKKVTLRAKGKVPK